MIPQKFSSVLVPLPSSHPISFSFLPPSSLQFTTAKLHTPFTLNRKPHTFFSFSLFLSEKVNIIRIISSNISNLPLFPNWKGKNCGFGLFRGMIRYLMFKKLSKFAHITLANYLISFLLLSQIKWESIWFYLAEGTKRWDIVYPLLWIWFYDYPRTLFLLHRWCRLVSFSLKVWRNKTWGRGWGWGWGWWGLFDWRTECLLPHTIIIVITIITIRIIIIHSPKGCTW